MYTLIIDANFFGQRIRNASSATFVDNPEQDRIDMLKSLAASFATEFKRFDGTINRVVWARDYSSWRKDFNQIVPIESTKTEEESEYKANRKDDGTYNIELFFKCLDEFTDLLAGIGVNVIRQYKAEADDICHIVSRLLSSKSLKSILWSSDGDYIQNVNEDVVLFKLPTKHLYLTNLEAPKTTIESVFNQKPDLINKIIKSVGDDMIKKVNPYDYVIEQIVHGQGKDNIPALFFWIKETKRGPQTYKPSWNHIKKSFAKLGKNLDEATTDLLYDMDFNRKLIIELLEQTKQNRDVEHTLKVFVSNRKLAFLDKREIPEDIWSKVVELAVESFKTVRLNAEKASTADSILSKAGISATAPNFFNQFDLAT